MMSYDSDGRMRDKLLTCMIWEMGIALGERITCIGRR
jgi:hypothetical protein